ncbi:MAG: urease accessory protein UreF [SAR116 cluster bacterium]|nr:MAG: urease accessory protein UreF [SAR116 cluster bacterium]
MEGPIAMIIDANRLKIHRMHSWFSSSFPTGGFAYSHGLEQAVSDGMVENVMDVGSWLGHLLESGSLWNDAVIFAHAYRDIPLSHLPRALAGSRERLEESLCQGTAFSRIAGAMLAKELIPDVLPVVCANAARYSEMPLNDALALYLHATVANLVSGCVRLVPLGQTEGQLILQELFANIEVTTLKACHAGLEDLGGASFASDICAMRHEDMMTRIFRT